MNPIQQLTPALIWKYFNEMLSIPRPSKFEKQIIDYLLQFGKLHNLKTNVDKVGNVLISKKASRGKENIPILILQSHVDMVCEKNNNVNFNFQTDPIQAYIDGDWIKARGTTLGADNGIGVAAMLAVLESTDIAHGPIECLFTVDEETGLTGAANLEPGFFQGKILINLDSEDEGEIFIGCAGGIGTVAKYTYETVEVPAHSAAFKLQISGLTGGHSGDDINKGFGNSIKILNRLLWNAANAFQLRISQLDGGNLHNAIPRESWAIVTIPQSEEDAFLNYVRTFGHTIINEIGDVEKKFKLDCYPVEIPESIIDEKCQIALLNALYACPNGVIGMSRQIPGLVETSTNLASVKMIEDNQIKIGTSQRSSFESLKYDISDMVASVFYLSGVSIERNEGYPGWQPNLNSPILQLTKSAYIGLYDQEPLVKAIHAGLECGLFLEKYPNLDMVSFGPTIKGVHSPDERMHIPSVDKFWKLLVRVLEQLQ